ncbi:MAG: hypothetical protein ACPG4N_12050 [Gammaproteobacteria bacterium]
MVNQSDWRALLSADSIDPGQIPGWAKWLAQDEDGAWWVFEAEPNEAEHAWYENEVGRYRRLGQGASNPDWASALFKLSA